jgi:hypothetical protein
VGAASDISRVRQRAQIDLVSEAERSTPPHLIRAEYARWAGEGDEVVPAVCGAAELKFCAASGVGG